MARTQLSLPRDPALRDERDEERWPVPYSALLVVVSSVTLWALIIGGVRWLLF